MGITICKIDVLCLLVVQSGPIQFESPAKLPRLPFQPIRFWLVFWDLQDLCIWLIFQMFRLFSPERKHKRASRKRLSCVFPARLIVDKWCSYLFSCHSCLTSHESIFLLVTVMDYLSLMSGVPSFLIATPAWRHMSAYSYRSP